MSSKHVIASLLAAFAVFTAAFMPAFAVELKIGYVNAAQVVEEAPQGDAALRKLEAEFGPRDRELVELRDEIRQLEEELERDKLTISDAERIEQEKQLRVLRRRFQRESQEFREDYNLRRNEELAELQQIVYKAIVELAKEENYDLILHEGTVYASDAIDITDKVLEKLENQ